MSVGFRPLNTLLDQSISNGDSKGLRLTIDLEEGFNFNDGPGNSEHEAQKRVSPHHSYKPLARSR